ncbi:MAG: NACHT domain-containing protein, partial [Gammaproteobacteria bacterium]
MSKDNLIKALKDNYASDSVPLGAKVIRRQFADGAAWPIASSFIRLVILLSSEEGDMTAILGEKNDNNLNFKGIPPEEHKQKLVSRRAESTNSIDSPVANRNMTRLTEAEEKDSSYPGLDRSLALERYEGIRAVKMPIGLDQLFNPLPQAEDRAEYQPRRKVWILGRAGVGKTTLTQRLAYEWAKPDDTDWTNQPRLFKSEVVTSATSEPIVIWVKLRELADYLDKLNLKEAKLLDEEACDNTLLVHEAVVLFIRQKVLLAHQRSRFTREALGQIVNLEESDNILYLLDGYDEIASLADNHSARQVCDYLLNMP